MFYRLRICNRTTLDKWSHQLRHMKVAFQFNMGCVVNIQVLSGLFTCLFAVSFAGGQTLLSKAGQNGMQRNRLSQDQSRLTALRSDDTVA